MALPHTGNHRLELVEGLGVEVFGCTKSQFFGSKVTNGTTVHREIDGTGRGNNLDTLLLKLKETLCTDGLDLRHNDIRLVLVDDSLEGITIKHREYFSLISYLHSRRIIITITGYYVLPSTHGGYHKLLSEFS